MENQKTLSIKRKMLLILCAFWCIPFLTTKNLHAQGKAILNATIIDGLNKEPRENKTLLLRDGKIEKIGDSGMAVPAGYIEIDAKGAFLLPGLIDAHVHIASFGEAKRALLSGVTTARSMGASNFADVGLRELAKTGKIEAPEILAAGYHVRPSLADDFFINRPELSRFIKDGVHGTEAMQTVAGVLIEHKVNWIKTNATARAGLPHTDPRQPYYNEDEMRALVNKGAASGIPVAAHAHGDEGGFAAVKGGVRSIEHGTYLSERTLRLMAAKGTYLVPTIAVVEDLTMPGGDYDNPTLMMRGRHMLPRIRQTARMAHKLGVKLIAATDTGYGTESTLRLSQELEEFVRIGMSPFEAIQAATNHAAELLGLGDQIGIIKQGYDADIILLEQNPLQNIGALHDLLFIMNNGKIIKNRLTW